jgi:hypothetical protein
MGDGVGRRMAFYKKMLEAISKKYPPGSPEFYSEFVRLQDRDDAGARQDGIPAGAMNRALQYFGLDVSQPADWAMLLNVLCEVVFGELPRGRKKGATFWTRGAYLVLAELYFEKAYDLNVDRSLGPLFKRNKLTDSEVAELISVTPEFSQYRNSPDEIRKRIPEARRQHEAYEDAVRASWRGDPAEG